MVAIAQQKFRWFLLIALPILFLSYFLWPIQSLNQMTLRAKEAHSQAKYEKALRIYVKILKKFKNLEEEGQILLNIARIYDEALLQPLKAIKAYQILLDKYPKSFEARKAYERLAVLHVENEDFMQARVAYHELLKAFPYLDNKSYYLFQIAKMDMKLRRYSEAREQFFKIFDMKPADKLAREILYHIGLSYYLENQVMPAIKTFKAYLKNYGESADYSVEVLHYIALSYERNAEYTQALFYLDKLIAKHPNQDLIVQHQILLKQRIAQGQKTIYHKQKVKEVLGKSLQKSIQVPPNKNDKNENLKKNNKKSKETQWVEPEF